MTRNRARSIALDEHRTASRHDDERRPPWHRRRQKPNGVRLAGSGRDGDRLQHLRRVLPCEVRVTSLVHPLAGRLLPASAFKRWRGVLLLVVVLPDGSPGTIPADATDVLGGGRGEVVVSVLSVEGVRRLRGLVGGCAVPGWSADRAQRRK